MQVAEIAVRFGDTVLDVRHLATGTFRIGNGREVDLAVVGLTSFPLVEWTERGCMLRVPAGMHANVESGPLARGDRAVLAIGGVAITVELIERTARLPKPRVDLAWPRWIAGALVAHLIALLAIDTLADPEADTVRVASLYALLPRLPDPPPLPTDKPKMHVPRKAPPRQPPKQVVEPREVSENEIEIEAAAAPAKRAVARARRAGILASGGITAAQIRAITGTVDLDKATADLGPVYDEVEAEGKRFGGGRRFDPTKREGWGTVAGGRYATVSNGRAVGDHYTLPGEVAARPLPKVAHCVGSCTATGGLTRDAVRVAIARYDEAILGCYERAGAAARGDVVVEVSIGEDGKVITSDGAGLGTTGPCVAGVLRRVAFPRAAPTIVRYPLSFSPS
jgi:hypothetical protein